MHLAIALCTLPAAGLLILAAIVTVQKLRNEW